MLPMKALRLKFGTLLAADSGSLAPAVNANKIFLINAVFTPNENLIMANLSQATFTGSTPIAGVTGTQPTGVDPTTGDQIITISPPAGGYIWTCTVAPGAPETIYGYGLADSTLTTLLAVDLLVGGPVTIQAINDQIDIGNPTFKMVARPAA
jgi:hypothetical protein